MSGFLSGFGLMIFGFLVMLIGLEIPFPRRLAWFEPYRRGRYAFIGYGIALIGYYVAMKATATW